MSLFGLLAILFYSLLLVSCGSWSYTERSKRAAQKIQTKQIVDVKKPTVKPIINTIEHKLILPDLKQELIIP